MVSDSAFIAARLPWWGALLFGGFLFALFYFAAPLWIEAKIADQASPHTKPVLEAALGRRTHWLEWMGIAFGLLGVYFAIRNYFFGKNAGRGERSIAAILARIFGHNLD